MERTYCLFQEITPDEVRIHNSNSPPKSVLKRYVLKFKSKKKKQFDNLWCLIICGRFKKLIILINLKYISIFNQISPINKQSINESPWKILDLLNTRF